LDLAIQELTTWIKGKQNDGINQDELETAALRKGFIKNEIAQAIKTLEENSEIYKFNDQIFWLFN